MRKAFAGPRPADRRVFVLLGAGLLALLLAPTNAAAAPPQVAATWVTGVSSTAATLRAEVSPGGPATGYHFEYLSAAAYQANLGAGLDGFAGASRIPPLDKSAGSGTTFRPVSQEPSGLAAETVYRYRVVAKNVDGVTVGPERVLTTKGGGGPLVLLDNRGWEMVSPVDKNGGEVQGFGGNAGGGVLQAATGGGAATYSSRSSFGEGGQGAPVASQYISRRSPTGWTVENVTAPLYSGAYGEDPDGVPYRLFSSQLDLGLLAGVPDLPLPGTGAPAGYANYYLRDGLGGLRSLLSQTDVAGVPVAPSEFRVSFAGASADLRHVVLSSCAALTPNAVEVPGVGGCEAASPNLYAWSGSGLRLVNVLPAQSFGTPPGRLAAPVGAISDDGSRIYWTDGTGLYLREGTRSAQVDSAVGGGGEFQLATPSGAVAFFTKAEHLYGYVAASEATVDLTPGGGVKGVLGAAADGSRVYFATAAGIFVAQGGGVAPVAAAPDTVNFPPSAGVARVSADGSRLLFVSTAELTPYDNLDANPKNPVRQAEVYLYNGAAAGLTCLSCIPTGERPSGSARIPGTVANGEGLAGTRIYRPRVMTAGGRRIFFESPDALVFQDTNQDWDVYEWEESGTGSCAKPQGCLQPISSGVAKDGATFVDASADGADVFFLTDDSLVKSDPGAVDLYDAREGGGFPEPPTPIPCEEDACQPLPSPPEDRSPGSLVPSTGNPPVSFPKAKKAKKGKGSGKKAKAKKRGSKKRGVRKAKSERRHGRGGNGEAR